MRLLRLLCALMLVSCSSTGGFVDPNFTEQEIAILDHARKPTANADEKMRAQSICRSKCKICFDGQNCDLSCALSKCVVR